MWSFSASREVSIVYWKKDACLLYSTKAYIYSTSCQMMKSNKQNRYDEDKERGTRKVDPNKEHAKWFVSVICYVI